MTARNTETATKVDARELADLDGQIDQWEIENVPEDKHPVWMDFEDKGEMQRARKLKYEPVLWKDGVVSAFADEKKSEDDPVRQGNRILMWCPKDLAMARRHAKAQRFRKARLQEAEKAVAGIAHAKSGVSVTPEIETTQGPPPKGFRG
jgi:hypothetical protein